MIVPILLCLPGFVLVAACIWEYSMKDIIRNMNGGMSMDSNIDRASYSKGFREGEENAFDKILEIIESLNHNGVVSTRLLRGAIHSLKGDIK